MAAALSLALDRKEWTLAALYLLLGVAEAASRLPPDTFESLLELLEGMPGDDEER